MASNVQLYCDPCYKEPTWKIFEKTAFPKKVTEKMSMDQAICAISFICYEWIKKLTILEKRKSIGVYIFHPLTYQYDLSKFKDNLTIAEQLRIIDSEKYLSNFISLFFSRR